MKRETECAKVPQIKVSGFPIKSKQRQWTTIHDQFRTLQILGQGTYGVVYKAEHIATGKIVALKRCRLDVFRDFGIPETTLREIALLRNLTHENIMQLYRISCNTERLYMICEYLDFDLKKYIKTCPRMSVLQVKEMTVKILRGLAFCHGHRIIHRDLKPHNILVSQDGKDVKIADFGLARSLLAPGKTLTHEVITLWYRAPELLLGDCNYSASVDIWSAGCIIAELLNSTPLFMGDSEIDTLFKICRVLGTPEEFEWPRHAVIPWKDFPKLAGKPHFIQSLSQDLDVYGVDFLRQMLRFDPTKRLSASELLSHPWLHEVNSRVPTREHLPSITNREYPMMHSSRAVSSDYVVSSFNQSRDFSVLPNDHRLLLDHPRSVNTTHLLHPTTHHWPLDRRSLTLQSVADTKELTTGVTTLRPSNEVVHPRHIPGGLQPNRGDHMPNLSATYSQHIKQNVWEPAENKKRLPHCVEHCADGAQRQSQSVTDIIQAVYMSLERDKCLSQHRESHFPLRDSVKNEHPIDISAQNLFRSDSNSCLMVKGNDLQSESCQEFESASQKLFEKYRKVWFPRSSLLHYTSCHEKVANMMLPCSLEQCKCYSNMVQDQFMSQHIEFNCQSSLLLAKKLKEHCKDSVCDTQEPFHYIKENTIEKQMLFENECNKSIKDTVEKDYFNYSPLLESYPFKVNDSHIYVYVCVCVLFPGNECFW